MITNTGLARADNGQFYLGNSTFSPDRFIFRWCKFAGVQSIFHKTNVTLFLFDGRNLSVFAYIRLSDDHGGIRNYYKSFYPSKELSEISRDVELKLYSSIFEIYFLSGRRQKSRLCNRKEYGVADANVTYCSNFLSIHAIPTTPALRLLVLPKTNVHVCSKPTATRGFPERASQKCRFRLARPISVLRCFSVFRERSWSNNKHNGERFLCCLNSFTNLRFDSRAFRQHVVRYQILWRPLDCLIIFPSDHLHVYTRVDSQWGTKIDGQNL